MNQSATKAPEYTSGYRSAISKILKGGASKQIARDHCEMLLPDSESDDFVSGRKKACYDMIELLERVNEVPDYD